MAELKDLLVAGKARFLNNINGAAATFSGTVTAPTFKGSLNGNASTATSATSATKATQDGNGNVITSTYAVKNHASTATTYGVGDESKYGHVILYPAASCTTFTSDSGGAITPAAAKKAVTLFTNDYAPTKTGGGASGTWGINITGNAATATSAASASSATIANRLNLNGISDSTTYGTYSGIIQDSSTGPNSGAWHNTIKILHNNSDGYYTSIATQFTGEDGLWFRSYRGGVDHGWKRVAVQNMDNTFSGYNTFTNKITQGSPSADTTIANMNRFQTDLFVQGNGSAPNSPKVAGFYLGKSASDENRHMDIVSGSDYAYIDFNKASVVEDYKARLIVNVTSGLVNFQWNSATDARLNADGVLSSSSRIYTGYDSGAANSVSCSNWFRSYGDTGWFNASYETHIRPNTVSSYGSIRMHGGARGGYEGIHFGEGNNGMTVMSIDGSHQGLYQESTGTWIIYNLNGNIGIGTSGLTSGYKVTQGSTSITGSLQLSGQIKSSYSTGGMWISGRDNATIRNTSSTSGSSFAPVISSKTQLGSWDVGPCHPLENFYFSYASDTDYSNSNNTSVTTVHITNAGVIYGACWNDYAEYRQQKEKNEIPYGRVVIENNDDTLSLSTERLMPGGNICSDTFGFAIGETDEAKMPIAVSGRVLVYTNEDRYSYNAGDALCTGPNGTVSKMTREEIKEYPDRIIAYVSAIPNYETWGQKNIAVDGRIWVKVV